jgi:hypothetical protein
MHIPFHLVDVFAERPLTGNPLAVVPQADELDDSTMQSVARELKQAETTFLMSSTRKPADWRLRSFTAGGVEVFGAGHNSLGARWWLAESGLLPLAEGKTGFTQEIGDRLLPVEIESCDRRVHAVHPHASASGFRDDLRGSARNRRRSRPQRVGFGSGASCAGGFDGRLSFVGARAESGSHYAGHSRRARIGANSARRFGARLLSLFARSDPSRGDRSRAVLQSRRRTLRRFCDRQRSRSAGMPTRRPRNCQGELRNRHRAGL